jgi:cell division protein FtsB
MKKVPLFSILFVIVGAAAIAAVALVSVKESKRNRQINEEIVAMQQEAEKIRINNESLREKITYFETPEFQEGIAKEKLNLQKPDERVVIVKPSPSLDESLQTTGESSQPEDQITVANYKKWWNQFFE